MRQFEVGDECLVLFQRALQDGERHVERLLRTQVGGQRDAAHRLRTIVLFGFQTGRERGLEYVANGRHVIGRNPLP